MSKKIGIIGGLGPMATVCLMELLDSKNLVIINDPTTPDRTKYILDNKKDDPTPNILNMIKKLESQNVDIISMPCNTASYFYESIKDNISCEFVSIVDETVKYIKHLNIGEVGLLATNGTIKSRIYENAFSNHNIKLLTPSYENQENVMSIIYDEVKAGKKVSIDKLKYAINDLKNQGAKKIILGCTELSVIYNNGLIDDESLIDSIKVLANVLNKKAKD